MLQYGVGGRNPGSGGGIVAALWNPSSAVVLWVTDIKMAMTVTTSNSHALQRITTRGTPGSTVTPDIDNNLDGLLAPPSGALLDLSAYTVDPTIDASVLGRGIIDNAIGAGNIMRFGVDRFRPIKVPPGTGLAVVPVSVLATRVRDVACRWAE